MNVDLVTIRTKKAAHTTATVEPTAVDGTSRSDLRTGVIGLLTIQLVIGYEWFISGLTKLWRGGFATGLADELRETSQGVTGWYRSFLDDAVIPHGWAFGWFVLGAELAVGTALLGGGALLLARYRRLGFSARQALLLIIALASIGGILMNIAFHLANGNPHPWLIPEDGFDEGVDLDSVMPLTQLAFVIVAAKLYLRGRLTRGNPATP